MELWEAFLLGIIQGITEFLPISSSGHLVLMQSLLGFQSTEGITFEIVVHFGSLVSILIVYRSDLKMLLKAALGLLARPQQMFTVARSYDAPHEAQRWVLFVLVSMLPAVVIGLLFKSSIEVAFKSPIWVSWMLLATGTMLFSTRTLKPSATPLRLRHAIGMGLAQAVAILPGVSRSGSTISAGLQLGLDREQAARFSFLMVIPVILGAMGYEALGLLEAVEPLDLAVLFTGFVSSLLMGWLSLTFLIQVIKRYGIHWFAYYCWAVGLVGLWYFIE
jgi:undecaprenyl-diphosphatase